MTNFYLYIIGFIIVCLITFISYRKKLVHLAHQLEADLNVVLGNVNLQTYISKKFPDAYIKGSTRSNIEKELEPIHSNIAESMRKMKMFLVKNEILASFLEDYANMGSFIKTHNEKQQQAILMRNKDFFDHVLKYPLDNQQRRAIISEEDNCLVVSSAGSGKTSSIVGKVEYLTKIKHINPREILLISYTQKAAQELTNRMNIEGLKGYTFHKLALDIIARENQAKPSICDNTDAVFVSIFHELLAQENFKKAVFDYFVDYQESEQEKLMQDRRNSLSEQKSGKLKALFPDMDGNAVYVRSEQEKKLCFVLTSLGLKFRYEECYEHALMDENHSQYRPDFSIYYEKDGKLQRLYLENFGVDEHGMVPLWFAKDKGISYQEANARYGDGITWKREVHKKFHTLLIETTSADFHYFDILQKVRKTLQKEHIPFQEIPQETLYDMVLPKNSLKEKAFIRLAVTFITLMKTNCKSLEEIRNQARMADDERSLFIIDNIITPVYDKYVQYMREKNLKDFTDIIIEATSICNQKEGEEYKYIIVDEFQDISMDRYRFLLTLRKGKEQAQLFCVGDDWQSIYRFSGSDMSLFTDFESYFGVTDVKKIETTYRFGYPLVDYSSNFIQKNPIQIKKSITAFNQGIKTDMLFYEYDKTNYASTISGIVESIPSDKSIFLLGRYSFDDYYLSYSFKSIKRGNKFFYIIGGREVEFLTMHKSKGLEADYVIILQCNEGSFGFPSAISDDPILNLIVGKGDEFPYGEERRLFYVAMTRAKIRTCVLYNKKHPSVFVTEFLHPEKLRVAYTPHRNANKRWGTRGDAYLLKLYHEGKSISQISSLMGRSMTSIVMRLEKLGVNT